MLMIFTRELQFFSLKRVAFKLPSVKLVGTKRLVPVERSNVVEAFQGWAGEMTSRGLPGYDKER